MLFTTVSDLNEAMLNTSLSREDEQLARFFYEGQIMGYIPPDFEITVSKTKAYLSKQEGKGTLYFFTGSKKNAMCFLKGYVQAKYEGVKPL
jgi:hypothetical protein